MANILDSLDLESAEALLEQERRTKSTKDSERDEHERSSSRHRKKKKHRSRSRSGSRKKKHSKKKSRERSRSNSKKRKRSKDRKHKRDRERDESKDREKSRSHQRDKENNGTNDKIAEGSKDQKVEDLQDQEEKRKQHLKAIEEQLEEAKRLAEEAKRDDLTVLILQLSLKTSEYDIYGFFQKGNCGSIRDIRIIKDPRTGKSKGVAYIEFYTQESVIKAIAMNGKELNGHTVRIQPSQAEKNRAAAAAKNYRQMKQTRNQGDSHQPGVLSMKILVQGLTDSLSLMQEQDLRDLFSPFGDIDSIELPTDSYGNLKGFAFIQYRNPDDARAAIKKMNGFTIGGRQIRVSNIQPGMIQLAGESQNLDLDEESGASYIHNAQSRALLMQKLLREDGTNPPTNQGYNYSGANPSMGVQIGATSMSMPDLNRAAESHYPTQYLVLPKLYDYASVDLTEEPGYYMDLREEVEGECKTYGQVNKVFVEQSAEGNVWVEFRDIKSAEAAKSALSKRFFQGQKLNPFFVSQATFNQITSRH